MFKFPPRVKAGESPQLNGKENYNVILIIIDDLRPDHLGCYGYNGQISPAIDKIAKDSVLFENAFSQAAYTIASTMSIFTSLYPSSHGVFFINKDKLSSHVKTIAEIFKLYDYRTAWFSVLDAANLDLSAGFGRGFQDKEELGIGFQGRDKIIAWLEKNKNKKFFLAMDARRVHDYFSFLEGSSVKSIVMQDNSGPNAMSKEEIEMDKIFYQRLVKLARSKKIPLDDPKIISEHRELFNGNYKQDKTDRIKDLLPPEKKHQFKEIEGGVYVSWINAMGCKNTKVLLEAYDACILAVDQELIRPIEEKLRTSGLYDKTIIIITADHGEAFGEHGIYGHGCSLYDEFIHIPLIIKMPHAKESKKIKGLVQSIDIMPTLLELVDIEKPHQAQGKSLVSFINARSDSDPNEYIFSQSALEELIRSRDWKLYMGRDYGKSKYRKILFNLSFDPGEQKNVYSKNQAIAERLESELKKWGSLLPSYIDKEYSFPPEISKETRERIKKTGYW